MWSPVLASLCFEEMLAQVVREADDGDRDAVVLERPGCPGPRARQERGCSQRVAQAQDELRPRVDGGGYPGQLESVGEDFVALRAPWGRVCNAPRCLKAGNTPGLLEDRRFSRRYQPRKPWDSPW